MVRHHVYDDVNGHDLACGLQSRSFREFGVAAILEDRQAGSSSTGSACASGSELVDACSGCTRDDAGAFGSSSSDAVEVA
jgi:hypothetical protein